MYDAIKGFKYTASLAYSQSTTTPTTKENNMNYSTYTAVVPMQWIINPPSETFLENLPNKILILTHDVINHGDKCAEALKEYKEIQDHEDTLIILDNSASELANEDFDYVDYISAIEMCGGYVDEFCIPDILEQAYPTIDECIKFVKFYEKCNIDVKKPQLMFIPQGENISQFQYCLETVLSSDYLMEYIKCIGIPRNICPRLLLSRDLFIPFILNIRSKVDIHLLGFIPNVANDLNTTRKYPIRSIDSAVPLRASVKNVVLHPHELTFALKCEMVGPRETWFENPEYSELVEHNIIAAIKAFSV